SPACTPEGTDTVTLVPVPYAVGETPTEVMGASGSSPRKKSRSRTPGAPFTSRYAPKPVRVAAWLLTYAVGARHADWRASGADLAAWTGVPPSIDCSSCTLPSA